MHSGFLLIDKPEDWTSHDVVGYIRNVVKRLVPHIKRPKVGHAGTLDPFATGLLILGIRKNATKRIDEFKNMPKEYIATIRLGYTSDTYDKTGTIVQFDGGTMKRPTEKQIISVLRAFTGKQFQLPPMHSAKKVNGKRLYKLARKGIEVEREPHEIEISTLELISSSEDQITLKVACSPGTYIRTLAHDIGQTLGVGAYCEALRRTKIGPYSVTDAHDPKAISIDTIQSYLFDV